MKKLIFKRGSTPLLLHTQFAMGKSLTYDEAYELGVKHVTQRVADLKKKFEEAEIECPLMVVDEPNKRGGTHVRYFYRGFGCPLENVPGARPY
jgi:hypothetical protein